MLWQIYTGVLGSLRRVGDAGSRLSLFSGSLKIGLRKVKILEIEARKKLTSI